MQLTSSLLLVALGVTSVAAGPTPVHRRHQKFHEQKRAVGDEVTAVIDGQVEHWVNTYSGEPTTTAQASSGVSPSAPAASGSASATASTGAAPAAQAANAKSLTSYKGFCPPASKRSTTEEIATAGNVGSIWGCNFMAVDNSIADQYDNVFTFTNKASSDQFCGCWNKIGPNNGVNGWWSTAISFDIPTGESQAVAVDYNSIGGCSCGAGSAPFEPATGYSGTWMEFNVGDGKTIWRAADISALVAQAAGFPVQAMEVCLADGSQCSSIGENASDVNKAYVKGMEGVDGVGINTTPGALKLNVNVG